MHYLKKLVNLNTLYATLLIKLKKENKNKLLSSTNNTLLSFSYIIEISKRSVLRGSK